MVLIIVGAVSLLIIIISIILLSGKGSFLIAGYNTMPKEKQEKYDAKKLCRFLGGILLPIGLLTPGLGIISIISWFVWVYTGVTILLLLFAVIYFNTGNRFKK